MKLNLENPKALLKKIPRTLKANIEFRANLHAWLSKNKKAQETYIRLCVDYPELAFDTLFFTLDPRQPTGFRNRPFILRPQQRKIINKLKESIDKSKDLAINKSRDEGATELVTKFFTLYFLFVPDTHFLVGSRKEEYVDRRGDVKTLFAKIDHVIKYLPSWLKKKIKVNRTHCHIGNEDIGSAIDGEATNENFGAGGRTTAVFLDEFGRIDMSLAKSIRDSVNDVTNSVIYGSTHWFGANHPFNKVVRDKNIQTVLLPWYENPEKNKGLYTSSDYDEIQILDIKYYRKLCPEVFNDIRENEIFKLSVKERDWLTLPEEIQNQLKEIEFVADGCETIPGTLRSPWHDKQERRRTKRDVARNLWMCPTGASDMFFDPVANDRIRASFCQPAKHKGEVIFKYSSDGLVNKKRCRFRKESGKKRLKWWSSLPNGRPNQSHNYIIGCDISLGTGSSNSCAVIIDVNKSAVVGCWECPNTPPELFADQVVALGSWIGGAGGDPYLIWENNGGHGTNFGRRVLKNGYHHCYTQKTEDAKRRRRKNKWGWNSNRERKADLLTELSIAVAESVRQKRQNKIRRIYIYYDEIVNELDDYIFYASGEIGPSEIQDESTGARQRHGDRVIALGVALLGMKEQPKATAKRQRNVEWGSLAHLRQVRKEREMKKKQNKGLY